MKFSHALQAGFAMFALLCVTDIASAGVIAFSGDTTGDPVWNRPVSGNPPTPPTSGVGTATPYEVFQFAVDTTGTYNFLSTATGGWDNYSFLYHSSFNPLDHFANVILGNDDFPDIGLSGFSTALTAGTQYFFVTTGFTNTDFGAFNVTGNGPGNISSPQVPSVPEPGSLALLGIGIAGWLGTRRAMQINAINLGD